MNNYNYKILEKDSTRSWIRVCFIDNADELPKWGGRGIQLLARDGIMHKIECVVSDSNSPYVCVYCIIQRRELCAFSDTMEDLRELCFAYDSSYFRYCVNYFASLNPTKPGEKDGELVGEQP